MTRRFSAHLGFLFTEWPFLDRFAAAAEAGFRAVEFQFPYDHPPEAILERLQRENLTLALFSAPAGDWAGGERGLAALPDRREAFRETVALAARYCEAFGAARLHVMAGVGEPDDPQAAACYRDSLAYAAEVLGPLGTRVLIEPINRGDMPGYYLHSFDTAVEVLEGLDDETVGLQFDLYHAQTLEPGRVVQRFRELLPRIGHVQVAGAPGRAEPGPGMVEILGKAIHALDDADAPTLIGCEYRPAAGTLAGLSWLNAFRSEFA